MKGIDPKWAMYLGLLVTIEQAIGHGTVSLTNLVPASWAPYITSWCNFLAFVGTAVMTYQAAVSAPLPGPAANTSISPAVKAAIFLGAGLALLSFSGGAQAQSRPKLTGNIVADINAAKAKPATKAAASQTVTSPIAIIQSFTESDLTAALADATANNDPAAVNCYTALLPIVKSGVANPLPTGLGGFQLLQKARDLKTMLANLQSPNGPLAQLNLACAPLVLDVQNTMVLLGVVGGGVALTGGAGGLALPGLGALIPGL